jgi:uncharacterized protein
MKCFTCPDSTLSISERSGVEIDYCPTCRSVWLDRGELDKIIERASEPPQSQRHKVDPDDPDRYARDRYEERGRSPGRKRKESFLGDLFDF